MAFYTEPCAQRCEYIGALGQCRKLATQQLYRTGKIQYGKHCQIHSKKVGKQLAEIYKETFRA